MIRRRAIVLASLIAMPLFATRFESQEYQLDCGICGQQWSRIETTVAGIHVWTHGGRHTADDYTPHVHQRRGWRSQWTLLTRLCCENPDDPFGPCGCDPQRSQNGCVIVLP